MRAEEYHASNDGELLEQRAGSGSVYRDFGSAVFLRGGYVFGAHGGGTSGGASAPIGAVGHRAPLGSAGASQFTDAISFKAAYRCLGATNDGTVGFHSAEAGLNFNF
jgi:hypothetical protein